MNPRYLLIQYLTLSENGCREHWGKNQKDEGGHSKLGQTKSLIHRRKGRIRSRHWKIVNHKSRGIKNQPLIFELHQAIKSQSKNVHFPLKKVKNPPWSIGNVSSKCTPDMNWWRNWNHYYSRNWVRRSTTENNIQSICTIWSFKYEVLLLQREC